MAKKRATVVTKEKAKAWPAQLGDMETLVPEPVNWEIGGKLFEQRPLTLKRLSGVMNEIVDVLLSGNQNVLLDQVVDSLSDEGEVGESLKKAVMPVLIRTIISMPEALPHVCALILDESAEEHLDEHLRGRQAIAILKTFIEQNEVGALLQDFFGLMGSLQTSVTEATAELETEEAENTDSSSENQKIEEASEPQ